MIKIDDPSPYSVFQSSSSNLTETKRDTKTDIHPQLWRQFPESVKHMVIDQNKKIKVVNPKSFSHGGKPEPKPNPNPQQVHLHDKDDFTKEEIPDNPTQLMVH